jgi:WD40 repeat protein
VVYLADQRLDEVVELHSAPIDGSQPSVRLNPLLASAEDVFGFVISPDGSRVLYLSDENTNNAMELFAVPIDGSSPAIRLCPPLTHIQDVQPEFVISPDGARIAYTADLNSDDVFELFSVSINGGASVQLNAPLVMQSVDEVAISPDGNRVVYRAAQEVSYRLDIYSVPITGGASVKLNADPFDSVRRFEIAPGGERVVYSAQDQTSSPDGFYSVPIAGGSPVDLLPGPSKLRGDKFDVSSGHVVYIAEDYPLGLPELYSVPIDRRTEPVELDAALPATGYPKLTSFRISRDERYVAFRRYTEMDPITASYVDLYLVPLGGGATPARMSKPGAELSEEYEFNRQGGLLYTTSGSGTWTAELFASYLRLPLH